jgi:hypothetical protein
MAADLIEYYNGHPAFQFITDVGVDWEESRVLDGEVGDFVVITRKERGTDNWFVGGITDENERNITINFDFLDEGADYKAILYKDGPGAHWDDNPESIDIEERVVDFSSMLEIRLAPGGGIAVSVSKI